MLRFMCRQEELARKDVNLAPRSNMIQAFGGHGGRGGCRWARQLAWRSQRKRQGQVGAWERACTAGSYLASEQGKEGESLQG